MLTLFGVIAAGIVAIVAGSWVVSSLSALIAGLPA